MFDRARKAYFLGSLTALILGLSLIAQTEEAEKKKPKGPYLGQTPPGTTPQLFAPGLVSLPTSGEYGRCFSPDGKEFYLSRNRSILCSLETEKGWTKFKKVPFRSAEGDYNPHITDDGTKLFFTSNRPSPDDPQATGIWVVDKVGTAWGQPRYHGPGGYVTITTNGNLYRDEVTTSGETDHIVIQRFEDGHYQPAEALGDAVNEPLPSIGACIARDESFLIFSSKRPGALGGEGDWDFYISFRLPDGSWGTASHFTEISSTSWDICASFSADSKYLFFERLSGSNWDIYWVSAEVVEKYRPKVNSGLAPGGRRE